MMRFRPALLLVVAAACRIGGPSANPSAYIDGGEDAQQDASATGSDGASDGGAGDGSGGNPFVDSEGGGPADAGMVEGSLDAGGEAEACAPPSVATCNQLDAD
jgi:hypothetical protein